MAFDSIGQCFVMLHNFTVQSVVVIEDAGFVAVITRQHDSADANVNVRGAENPPMMVFHHITNQFELLHTLLLVDGKHDGSLGNGVVLSPMPDEVFGSTGLRAATRINDTRFRVVCKVIKVKNSEV